MRELILAGELYIADDPQLGEDSRRAQALTFRLNTMDPNDHAGVRALLTELLGSFGEESAIRPPFQCDYGYQTHIGARTFANWGLVSLDVATVRIGDDVQIGPNVQLLTATHPIDPQPRRDRWEAAEPITIGDNVGSAAVPSSVRVSPSARTRWSEQAPSWSATCPRTSSRSASRPGWSA